MPALASCFRSFQRWPPALCCVCPVLQRVCGWRLLWRDRWTKPILQWNPLQQNPLALLWWKQAPAFAPQKVSEEQQFARRLRWAQYRREKEQQFSQSLLVLNGFYPLGRL